MMLKSKPAAGREDNNKKGGAMKCTLCSKTNEEVEKMVTDSKVNICSECINLMYRIINDDSPAIIIHLIPEPEPDIIPGLFKGFFDGSSKGNPGPCQIGYLVITPDGEEFKESMELGVGTNNIAEYYALLHCVRKMIKLGAKDVLIQGDSKLAVEQMLGMESLRVKNRLREDLTVGPLSKSQYRNNAGGHWVINHEHLRELASAVLRELVQLDSWKLEWIPRGENSIADKLAQHGL